MRPDMHASPGVDMDILKASVSQVNLTLVGQGERKIERAKKEQEKEIWELEKRRAFLQGH